MPARQRGFARKRGTLWLAVWRENGRERSRGGFATKTEALDYANTKAGESVAAETAIRFGDKVTAAASFSTVSELADAFLARYRADEATRRTFRARLEVRDRGLRRPAAANPAAESSWTNGARPSRSSRRTTSSGRSGRRSSTRSRWESSMPTRPPGSGTRVRPMDGGRYGRSSHGPRSTP